jgi:hypothetical protein
LLVQVDSSISEDAFRSAVRTVFGEHDALRTIFIQTEGVISGFRVTENNDVPVAFIDISDRSPVGQYQAIQSIETAEALYEFDLSCAPLARINVIRVSESQALCLFCFSHMILDGTSLVLVTSAILELARAGRQTLMISSRSYEAYAGFEASVSFSQRRSRALSYWDQKLEARELAIGRHRFTDVPPLVLPAAVGFTVRYSFAFDRRWHANLDAAKVRVVDIVLLAFYLVMYALTGDPLQSALLFNNGRDREYDAGFNMVGLFIGLLPNFFGLDDNRQVGVSARALREAICADVAHNQVSWIDMIRARYGSERYIYDRIAGGMVFNFLRSRGLSLGSEEMLVSFGRFQHIPTQYALSSPIRVLVYARDDSLQTEVLYRKDCFRPRNMEQFLKVYETSLTLLAEGVNTGRTVGSLICALRAEASVELMAQVQATSARPYYLGK